MKLQFEVVPYLLRFRFKAGTSRGAFTEKETWFIKASFIDESNTYGIGEASPLKGLSIDYAENYQQELERLLSEIQQLDIPDSEDEVLSFVARHIPDNYPSMRFGLETALLDLLNGGKKQIFDTSFHAGQYRIPINGLIWMGDEAFMKQQIEEKLKAGFNTIKMKVGAISFDRELHLLEAIRKEYSANDITLRVDANGAFTSADALERLEELAALEIHSIEQPIKPGQLHEMSELIDSGILPIALDEELIGVHDMAEKQKLIEYLNPQYLILKPSLVGGIRSCREWIELAENRNIGWWMTSMLESNIGLNAIAQFTSLYKPTLPQGLGTGQLYHNNIESPLEIRQGYLLYNTPVEWGAI